MVRRREVDDDDDDDEDGREGVVVGRGGRFGAWALGRGAGQGRRVEWRAANRPKQKATGAKDGKIGGEEVSVMQMGCSSVPLEPVAA